mmetsp:Transcript_75589/g.152937  ORF Transcript_75589/g.152937 Transcript_75589/m.152937 type:complete len:514 (+) Transcript_75589:25-1566(+)
MADEAAAEPAKPAEPVEPAVAPAAAEPAAAPEVNAASEAPLCSAKESEKGAEQTTGKVEETKKMVSPSASRSQGPKTRRDRRKKRSPQKTSGRRDKNPARSRRGRLPSGPANQPSNMVAGPIVRDGKAIYSYGNYDPYYKHRFDRCAEVDPRIQALLQFCGTDIFTDKVVLDVGCNSGFITFLVAALGARRVEGVDVDLSLITRALKHLRWLKQKGYKTMPEVPEEGTESDKPWHQEQYAVSCVQGRGHIPYHAKPLKAGALQKAMAMATKPEKAVPSIASTTPRPDFPYNIEFRAENFQLSQLELKRKTSYDVVLLLKITKWIHMMYGDVGIEELFAKCHELLRLGGLLILEAQGWHKYLEKKHQPPKRRGAHLNLMLRPDRFSELLGQLGFEKQTSMCPSCLPDAVVVFRKVTKTQAEVPMMKELFQEQQFLVPRALLKPPKVVPPRQGCPAASSPGAVPDVPEALGTSNQADEASATTEVEAPTVEDSISPPAKRLKTEEPVQSESEAPP